MGHMVYVSVLWHESCEACVMTHMSCMWHFVTAHTGEMVRESFMYHESCEACAMSHMSCMRHVVTAHTGGRGRASFMYMHFIVYVKRIIMIHMSHYESCAMNRIHWYVKSIMMGHMVYVSVLWHESCESCAMTPMSCMWHVVTEHVEGMVRKNPPKNRILKSTWIWNT